jgi:iron only hydrogenase large subunit-like protein/uncharacterized Fe-S cluster-containing protein
MAEYLKLKQSNCKNCYKCIRNCPVKSIRFCDNQAEISADDCILCGNCFKVCPQNAKEIRSDLDKARELIGSSNPVYASVAPSFVANYYGVTIRSMEKALKQLGFTGVEETAIGAAMVTREYEEMVASETQDVIISTSCHTVNLLAQKYYPEVIPYLARVVTPMQAHCRELKRRFPEAKTVFIGPCISKKAEAENCGGDVDCALTYEELTQWLSEEGVRFEPPEDDSPAIRARLFPTAGGILRTMATDSLHYSYVAIDGINSCKQAMKEILNGHMHKCFIEMAACDGGCIGGPVMNKDRRTPLRDFISVDRYAGREEGIPPESEKQLSKEFPPLVPRRIHVSESAIEDVLKAIGKTLPEHELNCGSCGYDTCREKAQAVVEGKANLTMCLPYLKEKAESFSDTVIKNMPTSIVVVNERYEVQLINQAACELLRLASPGEIMGGQVVRILDPLPFILANQNKENTYGKLVYLAEYGKYVEQTVIYDKNYNIILCFMRDVTAEVKQAETKQEISRRTIEVTDKVIEKQMRVVQEIASLLGETTAETKVALTKLKESLRDD